MSDIHITYRTITRKPRTGPVGRLLGVVADHPIRTGVVCGLAVVLIAALRSYEGVAQEPLFALVLSAIVIFAWTFLFYFMRPFFRQQTYFDVEVIREIQLDDANFLWLEHGKVIKALKGPSIRVYASPVPEEMIGGAKKKDLPWPVWLVVEANEGRFIVETKVTAREAADYEAAPADVKDAVDERLPVHVASPLLMRVRS